MYDDIRIRVLGRGGYVVQDTSGGPASYHDSVAAFANKADLLTWLDLNLTSRSPDLTGNEAVDNSKKDDKDEIRF